MKSSENEPSTTTPDGIQTLPSEVAEQPVAPKKKFETRINLKPYEYDPKDLEAFVQKYAAIDPVADMKAAKKARAEIKKKIAEIKKVHLHNKKVILEFKRDVESYDFSKFETLTADLTNAFNRINLSIEKIESAASIREQQVNKAITDLSSELMNEIMSASDMNEIQKVQSKIQGIVPDPAQYDNRVGDVSSMLTSMTLKAAGRLNEIMNAGGKISQQAVDPIQMNAMSSGPSRRFTDTELLNLIQGAAAQKGWAVMINPHTGVQIYQVDDPKAPKDIRVALEAAIVKQMDT